MASVQVDGPQVEEVSSHVEDKTVKAPLPPPPQNIEKEDQHHDYVEEEEDPEELDNVTPDHDHDHNDHEEKLLEDEDELLMGSEIVDHEGEKPTGGIEFSDEEEDD